jgi:Tetracyclin repressor-like, C-terminal domain
VDRFCTEGWEFTLEHLLALLHEGGLADYEAAWASDLLLYTTAVAAEHSTRQSSSQTADEDQVWFATITKASASRYPHVARLGDALFSGNGMERFEWGIDLVLTGALTPPRAGIDAGSSQRPTE